MPAEQYFCKSKIYNGKAIHVYGLLHFALRSFFCVCLLAGLYGCSKTEVKERLTYKGPLREVEKMETYYSEGNRIKTKMTADIFYEFENGDREFPKGIYIESFNDLGKLESTLKANNAYFFKAENKWRGRGKVEVKNIEKSEQLNTEELFWKQNEKRIFTDSFVTIREEGDVIYGVGLDAKQDLTEYTIVKPYGEFDVKEE
jgi:LPS export ABC transporter protein LptC